MSSPKIKSIKSIKNLKSKTVLVRCDFDVPLARRGLTRTLTRTDADKKKKSAEKIIITDDSRLWAAVPTIKYLLSKGAKVVLMGHLGRPGGKVKSELSLGPVKNQLEKILRKDLRFKIYDLRIKFINQFTSYKLRVTDYKIVMLENLRFNPGEEKNDPKFASKLAKLGDIYVNEAFAVSHRSAVSVAAIQNYLPSYAGLNLEQEILHLSAVLKNPKHPLVAIIGGAKIETKLPMIKQFMKIADYILVGGGVANTFLKASGVKVGKSLVDDEYLGEAKKIIKALKHKSIKTKILLPVDWQMGNNKILDIGPKTIWLFCGIIKKARTIVWNGPMGYFENKKFAVGTDKIAQAILNNKKAQIVIGGGETVEALKSKVKSQKSKVKENIFVSTGGGAMLEYLSGKKLPGIRKIIK